jgi:hypothetical protein
MNKQLIKEIVKKTIKDFILESHLELNSSEAKSIYKEMEILAVKDRYNSSLPYHNLVDIRRDIDALTDDADKAQLKKYYMVQFGTNKGLQPHDYDDISLSNAGKHTS